ncbi:hypothetical protein AVEN_270355-1 [Araneus ventricosus]|uniref:Uncharacterized protein n=1 Tax=Araneus ventricosus TaxID=182803 RepID=A0A4Y2MGG3_ARAVE|nr:hypothetical protein AVEN_270355-1 [Araneus ventricosus]
MRACVRDCSIVSSVTHSCQSDATPSSFSYYSKRSSRIHSTFSRRVRTWTCEVVEADFGCWRCCFSSSRLPERSSACAELLHPLPDAVPFLRPVPAHNATLHTMIVAKWPGLTQRRPAPGRSNTSDTSQTIYNKVECPDIALR